MDQNYSRPIRKSGTGDVANQELLKRATRVACISVKPAGADVIVKLTDGGGGAVLWEIEADNAAGSHSDSFGAYPLLFPNGIYYSVEADVGSSWTLNVAVVEPKAVGT